MFVPIKLLNIIVGVKIDMNESEKKSTEELILKEAEYEFLTKGFDGARTVAIAQRAGVTHAMLHYYFRTKEQLFDRIIADKFELISQMVFSVIGNSDLPLKERLQEGVAKHFDFVVSNPLLPYFFFNEVLQSPPKYESLLEKIRPQIFSLYNNLQRDVDAAVMRGEMEYIDVKMLFMSIFSLNIFSVMSCSFIGQILGENELFDREKYLDARKQESIKMIMCRIKK